MKDRQICKNRGRILKKILVKERVQSSGVRMEAKGKSDRPLIRQQATSQAVAAMWRTGCQGGQGRKQGHQLRGYCSSPSKRKMVCRVRMLPWKGLQWYQGNRICMCTHVCMCDACVRAHTQQIRRQRAQVAYNRASSTPG